MGTFDVSCSFTGLPILEGDRAFYGFAINTHLPREMRFVTPLYEGAYDGYGEFKAVSPGFTPPPERVAYLKSATEAYNKHWRQGIPPALVCYRHDVLLKAFPLLADAHLSTWQHLSSLVTQQLHSRQADLVAGDLQAVFRPVFEPIAQEAVLALGDRDLLGAFQTEDDRSHAFTPPRHVPKTSCTEYELRDVYLRFMLESEAVYGVGFIPNVSGQGLYDSFVKAYNRRHAILNELKLLTQLPQEDET